MLNIVLNTVAATVLLVGSYTDMRTREVPDWLSYSLIAAGFGIRGIYSSMTSQWNVFVQGLLGFVIFLIVALLMFYSRQWGGGDSKLLMGMGVIIGFQINLNHFLISFLINIFLIGAVYGIIVSLLLAFYNWDKFSRESKKLLGIKRIIIYKKMLLATFVVGLVSFLLISDFTVRVLLLSLILIALLSFYTLIFVKAIEKSIMIQRVNPKKLTLGDWVAEDVKVGNNLIASPKDLGLEEKQLNKILKFYKERKIKSVLIKNGIPFVPSFLLAFIFTLIFGNLFF